MRVITQELNHRNQHVDLLEKEAINFLGWSEGFTIDEYNVFDFEGATKEQIDEIKSKVFEISSRAIYDSIIPEAGEHLFRYRQVTGQYNETEEMTQKFVRNILGFENVTVHHSTMLDIKGITTGQLEQFKHYLLNPVENVEVTVEPSTPKLMDSDWSELDPIEGFIDYTEDELRVFGSQFAMDLDDLTFAQTHFKEIKRNPNLWELKVIDTYWSDHCRHTTFNTHIDNIDIEDGFYKDLFASALDNYLEQRDRLKRTDRPITLMELGTVQSRDLRAKGMLDDMEVSAEVNACTLEIKVDVDGQEEDWILYFKNETHNHPTEIEPFGGASTCLGGGVRDPLSGRSWVYQAMRVGGAHNPTLAWDETREGKLPQRVISQTALAGYSDYLNQYGVTGGYNEEVYHPGFEAKRMELGALISAAPKENIVKEEPNTGDKVILLGGKTGRDGVGGAVGSSKIQTEESLEQAGAEVQKGNASVQRKIGRLFRNGEATKLIRRCNDFGAGGVAVAIGELADGLHIELEKVPVKYDGMHAGEIAISESQERMAVVVRESDVEAFLAFADEEDVEATIVATVTDDATMTITYNGETVIQLSREFLDSAGADKHENALLVQPDMDLFKRAEIELSVEAINEYITDLNRASQQAMDEQFDATIGRATVLYPYGGKLRRTKELGMISRLPARKGDTTTTSVMAYGFQPELAINSPFHGGYYAVVESIGRLVALGFDYKTARLTFQEYFERLESVPERWGKPVLALLGANTVMDKLGLASIGGKDSMSGSFEELNVPPSLLSFAVATGSTKSVLSRAFKAVGNKVVLVENPILDDGTIDFNTAKAIYEAIYLLNQQGKLEAATTVNYNGLLQEIVEMSYGNVIGVELTDAVKGRLTAPMMGSFLLEVADESALEGIDYEVVGTTIEAEIKLASITLAIDELYETSNDVLASVYSRLDRYEIDVPELMGNFEERKSPEAEAKVLIPVHLGANTEYDLRAAFEAAGFESDFHIIKTSNKAAYQQSVQEFAAKIADYQVVAFASGFVFANEPDDLARGWDLVLEDAAVKEAIHAHLAKKRLIFGSGSAAGALIRTGLIEFGEIKAGTTLEMVLNPYAKFVSDIETAQIISQNSPWSNEETSHYSTALATKWGGIDLGTKRDKMLENGQVLSMFKEHFNEYAVDAVTSPDGLVFASVSNVERMDKDLYQNIEIVGLPTFIQQARAYFA